MMAGSQPLARRAYRIRQAAELLSLPYSTVYDIVRRGDLASVQVGTGARKILLIPRDAIDDFLRRGLSRTGKKPRL